MNVIQPVILILCTGNSCRSQIAEGYLKKLLPDHMVLSAGVETHGLNPRAVKVMAEDGIDISQHTSNHVDEYAHLTSLRIITVCDHAAEVCPVLPGVSAVEHHSFPDPAKAQGSEDDIMMAFREVRNLIRTYCADFTSRICENGDLSKRSIKKGLAN